MGWLRKIRRNNYIGKSLTNPIRAFKNISGIGLLERSKDARKIALTGAVVAGGYFAAPYVVSAASAAGHGVMAFASKFYGGATGAQASPGATDGYTQNDSGGSTANMDDQSSASDLFYAGANVRRGNLAIPAGAAAAAASCSGPAGADLSTPFSYGLGAIDPQIGMLYLLGVCTIVAAVWTINHVVKISRESRDANKLN